jgi:hypothetical protein
MELLSIFSAICIFSKVYLAASILLVTLYLVRSTALHVELSRLDLRAGTFSSTIDAVRDHCLSLREAQHISLALGRGLFAAELSQLLVLFTPLLRSTDAQPWFSIPQFLIVCQLCFMPVILLLIMDWALSIHLRRVIRSH